jgi:hypothetical protein
VAWSPDRIGMATTAPDRRTALRRVFAQSQVRAYLIVMCRIRKNLPQLCLSKTGIGSRHSGRTLRPCPVSRHRRIVSG